MLASRPSALFVAAIGTFVVLAPMRAHAQWWRSAPADFEACADVAEKAKTKEDKTAALAECNAKFAGRRKPGGGYTYYDFMQDRTFDIAGPNPTPAEQKKIDEQYTVYLDRERRNTIAAALMAKQQQQQVQQVSLRSGQEPTRAELRESTGAGGQPGQTGGPCQGGQLRQEFVLLRLAAAFGKHQRPEEAVQLDAEQGQAGLDSVIPRGCGESSSHRPIADGRPLLIVPASKSSMRWRLLAATRLSRRDDRRDRLLGPRCCRPLLLQSRVIAGRRRHRRRRGISRDQRKPGGDGRNSQQRYISSFHAASPVRHVRSASRRIGAILGRAGINPSPVSARASGRVTPWLQAPHAGSVPRPDATPARRVRAARQSR